nr:D-alanyl-D-alanine carboxypeptidase [Candidatus Eremiobacteraeota bacterium]
TLAILLARAELTPGGNQLYLALPRGGIEGTLRHYRFSTALGRVRAKSGHLTSVEALAGYVTTRRHGRIVFAFLIDSAANADRVDEAIARAVDRLAEF